MKRANSWTAQDEALLRRLYPLHSAKECAPLLGRTHKAVTSRAKVLRIRHIRKYHRWTAREHARLRKEYPETPTKKLAEAFGVSVHDVYARARELGLRKGAAYLESCLAECGRRISTHPRSIAGRIQKGNIPPNKGLHRPGWFAGRMRETWFKKGHHNEHGSRAEQPIGALRINADGYLERKVRMDRRGAQRWRAEHALIWEKYYGPVPPGHIVVFKDSYKTHLDSANLECISKAENMRRNSIHVRRSPEMKEAIFALGAVKAYVTKKEKKRGQKQAE